LAFLRLVLCLNPAEIFDFLGLCVLELKWLHHRVYRIIRAAVGLRANAIIYLIDSSSR